MQVVYERGSGLDIHKNSMFACVLLTCAGYLVRPFLRMTILTLAIRYLNHGHT